MLCVCLVMMTGLSQSSAQGLAPQVSSDEIGGLVINQTRSVQGNEFYEKFLVAWQQASNSQQAKNANLVIREERKGTSTSAIFIFHEHTRLYTLNLSIRNKLDDKAFESASHYVAQKVMQNQHRRSPDLYYTEF